MHRTEQSDPKPAPTYEGLEFILLGEEVRVVEAEKFTITDYATSASGMEFPKESVDKVRITVEGHPRKDSVVMKERELAAIWEANLDA